MTAVEVLAGVKDLLRRDGWCQNTWGTGTARCIVAAVGQVAQIPPNVFPTLDRLRRAAGVSCLASWNDASGRTLAEVLDLCDKAVELEPAA